MQGEIGSASLAGGHYSRSVRVDDTVLADLGALAPLAPLHQPHNLAVLRTLRAALPSVPQVACFDTDFNADAPAVEKRFALPEECWSQGVRRYGFRGLSYRSVMQRLEDLTPSHQGRVLMAHLGNGASLCAASAGRSVASTMGFSALDGLMMGTRCGALDAGVVLHLVRAGMSADALEDLLYRRSGLRGVSGIGADMRQLRASTAEAAVCTALGFLGIELDEAANRRADGTSAVCLQGPNSRVEVWLIPSDEGLMAAQDALRLISDPGVWQLESAGRQTSPKRSK